MPLFKKRAGAVGQITNPMASMHPCSHAIMQPCNIIPPHLFFPSSYLLSFPSSLFTPWPPEAREKFKKENRHLVLKVCRKRYIKESQR